jgi:antitoxin YefM
MSIARTPVPLSEAKAHLSELARRVRKEHERITLTRNGEAEAVLLSVDDLEGMEMTVEILGDSKAAARISESLARRARRRHGHPLPGPGSPPSHRRVTSQPEQRHEVRFQPPARRAIAQRLPESVPAARELSGAVKRHLS